MTKTKKTKTKRKSSFPFLLLLTALVGGGGWLWWQKSIAPVTASEQTEDLVFTVESGMAGQQIGEQLAAKGVISSPNAWKVWTKWQQLQDKSGGFKAGTYQVSARESLPTVANKIWQGQTTKTKFTIPEGWSIKQMATHFESLGFFSADEFIKATETIPYEKFPWLPQDIPHLEGFLYPDTYTISSELSQSPQRIIGAMLSNFERVALPVYKKANTDYSLLEWVSLASIVEKESVVAAERTLIAGVFTSRLEQGIRLESDPTVEYGLGIRQTADKPLTFAQVGMPNPYNTYRNFGLPPTAIAAPGIASLKATLNPDQTDYLFFVARYDGTHVFSKTLSEHEAATRKIRRERNARNSQS